MSVEEAGNAGDCEKEMFTLIEEKVFTAMKVSPFLRSEA